jgi:hypothetical protein
VRRTPAAFLQARLAALLLLSLAAVSTAGLAYAPGRPPLLESILFPALLSAAALGGAALHDRLGALLERTGRARLQATGWVAYGLLLGFVLLGIFSGEAGQPAVAGAAGLMRSLQALFLLFAGLGRGYLGAIVNAFVLAVLASLGGGPTAAAALISHAACLVLFLVADHPARLLSSYPVDSPPRAGPLLARGAFLALAVAGVLSAAFVLMPPQPYAPFRSAGPGAAALPPRELARILAELAGIGLLATVAFVVLLRLAARGAQDAPERRIEKVPVRRRMDETSVPLPLESAEGVAGRRGRIVKLYLRCLAQLARRGLRRRPSETPREFAARLRPAAAARELAELFVRARFGVEEPGEEDCLRAESAGGELLRG